MGRSAMLAACGIALAVACSRGGNQARDAGHRSADAGAATRHVLLELDAHEAAAFNGDLSLVDVKTVCGADDRRFLGELLDSSNPLDFKVPKRIADIKPA